MASDDSVVMAHGGGGQLTDQLIHQHILPRLGNPTLSLLGDSAVLPPSFNDRVALTIDSYVVQPWRFPGGDVGRIAVCGTVNDLSVTGATPRGIALGIVVSEGFSLRDLDRVLASVAGAAAEADVDVVAGDTKVVDYHDPPEIMLTTAGVGYRPFSYRPMLDRVHPGDKLLINGPVGDHGLAVMLARELPEMQVALRSDAAPLNHLIARCLSRTHEGVVFMRDATRGGLAGVTADIAQSTGLHVVLDESAIPIRPAARHAADLLGLDPLEIANEGKLVMIARPAAVDTLLMEMDGYGGDPWERPRVIGEITDIRDGLCELITTLGGRRILQKPYGEELPRIC
ncbi:MAG: hydrogenase expression/formation protein HypE [Planctomycetota bacterium]